MITVRFLGHDGLISGVETSGHAGMTIKSWESGSDWFSFFRKKSPEQGNILCASVSVLMFHLQAGLEAVAGLPVRIVKEKKTGFFRIVLENPKECKQARPYFLNLMVTMRNLEKKYPGKLKILEEDHHVS